MDSIATCQRCGAPAVDLRIGLCAPCTRPFDATLTEMARYNPLERTRLQSRYTVDVWPRYIEIPGVELAIFAPKWRDYTYDAVGRYVSPIELELGIQRWPHALLGHGRDGIYVQLWQQRVRWKDSPIWLDVLWRPVEGIHEPTLGGPVRRGHEHAIAQTLAARELFDLVGGKPRGRTRLEDDPLSNWREQVEKGEKIKRKSTLSYDEIATYHLNISPHTYKKYRTRYRQANRGAPRG